MHQSSYPRLGGGDLFWMGSPGDRADQYIDGAPFAPGQYALCTHDLGHGPDTMLVLPRFHRHAARHDSWHPVRGQPGTGQLGHADCHAEATEAVGHSGHNGCDHLGIRVGVAAHFVLTAVDLAAQCSALHQDVFEAKSEAFLDHILRRRKFQLCFFYPKRPLEGRLHTQRTFCASAAPEGRSLKGHCTPRIRRRSGVTSLRSSMAARMAVLIMPLGKYSSELTFAA